MAVKFEIFRDGVRLSSFLPVAAMAIGPESVPIVGTLRFKDGVLTIERNAAWPTNPAWALACLPQDSGWKDEPIAMLVGVVVKLRLPLTSSMLNNCNGTVRDDAPEFLTGSGQLARFVFVPNVP